MDFIAQLSYVVLPTKRWKSLKERNVEQFFSLLCWFTLQKKALKILAFFHYLNTPVTHAVRSMLQVIYFYIPLSIQEEQNADFPFKDCFFKHKSIF